MDNSVLARGLVMNKYGRYNWVYGHYEYDDETEKSYISGHNPDDTGYEFEVIPFTIGSRVFATDVNGKEIFDGDVCRYGHALFYVCPEMHADITMIKLIKSGKTEVIGNVFEDDNLRKLLGATDFWSDF